VRVGAALFVAALVGLAAAPGERPLPTDLSVTLEGPSTAERGTTSRFVISVRNQYFDPDLEARLTVRLSAGMRYVEPPGATVQCSGTSGTVVCQLTKLPVSLPFPVRSDRPGRAEIEATAEADVPDVRPANNTDRARVDVYGVELRLLRTAPAGPRRGRRFVASATLFRAGTRALVRVDARSASCPGAVVRTVAGSGRLLSGRATIAGARVSCAWLIPARPRGRFFRGAIVVRRSSGYQPKLSFRREIR
jgi:hypothetical protein